MVLASAGDGTDGDNSISKFGMLLYNMKHSGTDPYQG